MHEFDSWREPLVGPFSRWRKLIRLLVLRLRLRMESLHRRVLRRLKERPALLLLLLLPSPVLLLLLLLRLCHSKLLRRSK